MKMTEPTGANAVVEWCGLCEYRARIFRHLRTRAIDSTDRFLVRIISIVELILARRGGAENEVDSSFKN
jgi:hypothetical protein